MFNESLVEYITATIMYCHGTLHNPTRKLARLRSNDINIMWICQQTETDFICVKYCQHVRHFFMFWNKLNRSLYSIMLAAMRNHT